MSTHSTEKLLQLWKQEELTADQMVGHLLQHVETLEKQTPALEKQVQALEKRVLLLERQLQAR